MQNDNAKLKIIFLGTPEFGAIILEKLCQSEYAPRDNSRYGSNYKPVLAITAPDKPVGRKQILTPPPAKLVAQKYGVPILQPERIENCKSEIENLKPGLIVTAAYGKILPKEILDIPKFGCLNVHPSLLPRWRGASPIQYTILNGDAETGVSIMLMDEQIDHGEIVSNFQFPISNDKITYEELLKELSSAGAELLIETIPKWIKSGIKPLVQDESNATYTKILKKEDGRINWENSAEYIERQIRAFNPWPGTYSSIEKDGQKPKFLKIFKADILRQTENGPFGSPGKTYLAPNDKIAVQCGKDYLIIDELQPEGKKKMSAKEFIMGRRNFIGTILK